MTHENVVTFMTKLVSDEGLRARVADLEGDGGPESVRHLLQIADEEGLGFSESELDELVLAKAVGDARDELSLEQLDAVAGGAGRLMLGTIAMQEMSMDFNLQYLNLQQHMQSASRRFTSISNVMKTKHDTAKSAIDNIR